MTRWAALLVSLSLLSACAAAPVVWTRPGLTDADFRREKYRCVQESRVSWSGGGTGVMGLMLMVGAQGDAQREATKLFRLCMEAYGYTAEHR